MERKENGNPPKICIGFRQGKLTVVEKTNQRLGGYTVWRCVCDCGGEILLDTRRLQRGTYSDCGCETKVKPGMLDLTGNRFGKLVCIKPYNQKNSSLDIQWVCQCDCGNTCVASVKQLRAGYKKSCGCLSHPPLKEFVGKRFGKLTVIEYSGKESGMHRWRCVCDCGKETVVRQTSLQSGKTQSCGCLKMSNQPEVFGWTQGTSISVLEHFKDNLSPRNRSGYNGVYENKRGKWVAQMTFQGKTQYLGSFNNIEEAVKVRKIAEQKIDDIICDFYQTNPQWRRKHPIARMKSEQSEKHINETANIKKS